MSSPRTSPVSGRPDANPKMVCDHGLRRQAIVGSLLTDVFEGRLKAGRHLVTQELASRFGVSHTPIREALISLAALGVIDLQPNRGAVVRKVTPRDVREVCRVRRLLECEAARRACGRIDPAELLDLATRFRAQTPPAPRGDAAQDGVDRHQYIVEARELDSRLHDRIAACCGNAFLAQELTRLKTLFRAFRDVAWAHDEARNDYHRLSEETREHLSIVEALIAGDARSAALAMARHIDAGARYWGRVLRVNHEGAAARDGPNPTDSPTPTSSRRPSSPAQAKAGNATRRTAR